MTNVDKRNINPPCPPFIKGGIIFVIFVFSYANAGEMEFLNITPSSRRAAMGSAGICVVDGAVGSLINPALLSEIGQGNIALSHLSYFGSINYESAGIAQKFPGDVGFAINGIYLKDKEIDLRDDEGVLTGESIFYSAGSFSAGVGFKVNNYLSLGVNGKITQDEIDEKTAKYLSADSGAILKFNISDIDCLLGATISNLGEKALPEKKGCGILLKRKNLLLNVDYIIPEDEPFFNAGLEWDFGVFVVRVGNSKISRDESGVSIGFGLKIKKLSFDYAFVSHKDLGDTNQLGMSIYWGKTQAEIERQEEAERLKEEREVKVKELLSGALENLKAKKWDEVIKGCETVLELEPGNEKAANILALAKKEKGLSTIAVADFEATPPISMSDAAFITEFLREYLIKTGMFKLVDKKNMDKILAEQGFQQTGCTGEECVMQMGKILNVQKIVSGTYGKLGDYYIISSKVTGVESGEIICSEKVSFENLQPESIDRKIKELADKLTGALKTEKTVLAEEREQLKKEHFNLATKLFNQGKYDEAIAEWEKVLEIDPGHEVSKQKIEKAKSAKKELEKLPEQPLIEQ